METATYHKEEESHSQLWWHPQSMELSGWFKGMNAAVSWPFWRNGKRAFLASHC